MNDQLSTQDTELQVLFGSAVKDLGNGKIGGYAVLFTTAKDPDLTGDYFTKDTDFSLDTNNATAVYYAHTLDKTIKDKKLGKASFQIKDEVGVWVEAQLNLRDTYVNRIYQMVKDGELGFSTGSAPHLIRREAVKGASHLKAWPIVELSLTPTPAEPRTLAVPVKSIELEGPIDLESPVTDAHSIDAQHNGPHGSIDAPHNRAHGASIDIESEFPGQLTSPMNDDEITVKAMHPALSLKDHFDICLLSVRVLTNRLNSLKELRENQGKKSPLSKENLERVKDLHSEIKNLIEYVELALQVNEKESTETAKKQEAISQIYSEAASLNDWLDTLEA